MEVIRRERGRGMDGCRESWERMGNKRRRRKTTESSYFLFIDIDNRILMHFIRYLDLVSQRILLCQIAAFLRHWDVMRGTRTASFAYYFCHYLYLLVLGF